MSDLIDRQAAIDASCTCHGGVHCNHYPCNDVQAIMDLPSVQPDRKTSEWLHELLQDAIDDGIITEAQAVRIMERVKECQIGEKN